MGRIAIYPWALHCEGAISLRDFFREQGKTSILVKRDGVFTPKAGDFILGWGCSKPPVWENKVSSQKWANKYSNIQQAINKIDALEIMDIEGVSTVQSTSSLRRVRSWLKKGNSVLARTRVKGKQGEGIVILSPDMADADLPECRLYTKHEPSTTEFRIYSLFGETADALEKRRKNGTNDPGVVRTEQNNWVFCRQGVVVPTKVSIEAARACAALGLEFGGVDVLWNKHTSKATVLEVNTAPGIFGSGISKVGNAFLQQI